MRQKSKINQWLHDMLAGFILALAIITIWDLWDWVSNKDHLFSGLSGLWTTLCFVIGYGLMWGRKFFQKPANKVLSEDKRPPVVYLRSFKDDKKASTPIRQLDWPVFFTEEEYLVDVLNDFGPCVAIGQPGEKIPDLGAARMYLDDNEWQDKVRELLAASSLVVLRAGDTQNFFWEVEQSAKNVKPKNIIILIPRVKKTFDQFRLRANQYFPKPLPENIGDPGAFSGIASLYGYIYFDEDWTSHFIKFEFRIPYWQRRMADPVQYIIRDSFAPVYERSGMLVPKTEDSSLVVILVSFLLSILSLSILLNRWISFSD